MRPSPAPRELEAAYRATSYRVGTKLELRVGEGNAVLDALLEGRGLDAWAYLTAHNPGSVRLTPEENRAREATLRARLADRTFLVGDAVPDDPAWPSEASVLVLGMGRDEALALARELGQNAILAGTRGGVAELVWC